MMRSSSSRPTFLSAYSRQQAGEMFRLRAVQPESVALHTIVAHHDMTCVVVLGDAMHTQGGQDGPPYGDTPVIPDGDVGRRHDRRVGLGHP